MKFRIVAILFVILNVRGETQTFQWAQAYDIPACNEVAALTVDTNGYVFITGVYNAPSTLPYTGTAYFLRTHPGGEVSWIKYLNGSLQIGDAVAAGSSYVVIGQSYGPFTYQAENYGIPGYHLFMMKIDSTGNPEWTYFDATKNGFRSNMEIGKTGNIAVHLRQVSNIGDWIWILDPDGNLIQSKQISTTTGNVADLAYYNDWVYLNGGFNGPGSLIIDTIVINQPAIENAAFVLALDENLTAKWVSADTTINNIDGRIEANGQGIFVYQNVLEPPFNVVSVVKKFGFGGQILKEAYVPVFSNGVALYPDMTVTLEKVILFVQNAFNFDSHKAIIFDINLNLEGEKIINGPSDLYSGQTSKQEKNIYLAHVFSGDLNLNDEIMLPYSGTGKQPYVAKIGEPTFTGILNETEAIEMMVYPNPCTSHLSVAIPGDRIRYFDVTLFDVAGTVVLQKNRMTNNSSLAINHIPDGFYVLQVNDQSGNTSFEKIIIDHSFMH